MDEQRLKVIVIEDEAPVRKFLRSMLTGAGIQVIEAETGREGISLTGSHKPDVMLLDLGLPDVDGMEVIREVRDWSQLPILILSARGQEKDKVAALDAGADDYLTKPFGVSELLARIRLALRHSAKALSGEQAGQSALRIGELTIDFAARRVERGGTPIHLTVIEYKLLTTLAQHVGRVLTHAMLIKEVWGRYDVGEKHPIRVYMAALRRKIEPDATRPRYIITEQGVGYRLVEE